MAETKDTPEPSAMSAPLAAMLASWNIDDDRPLDPPMYNANLVDAALAAERQQHRDAFAELQQRRDDVMTLCGLLSLQAEEELEPSIMRMRDALAAQAQELADLKAERDMWRESYHGTDHAKEQAEWQQERDAMVAKSEAEAAELTQVRSRLAAVDAENTRLRTALESISAKGCARLRKGRVPLHTQRCGSCSPCRANAALAPEPHAQ